jgi:Protein SCAI
MRSLSGSRLSPLTTPPCERSAAMTLSLQEILIVGSACEQAKFSELTMDMFRILQTLEREPQDSIHALAGGHPMIGPHSGPHDTSPATSRMPYGVPGSKGNNLIYCLAVLDFRKNITTILFQVTLKTVAGACVIILINIYCTSPRSAN